jgi:hypothetical protein
MARVFFLTGRKGGAGNSVGSVGLLDYFEMGSRKVSLVETDTANPDVGNALRTSSIRSVAMIPPSDDLLNFFLADRSGVVPDMNYITVRGILEKRWLAGAAESRGLATMSARSHRHTSWTQQYEGLARAPQSQGTLHALASWSYLIRDPHEWRNSSLTQYNRPRLLCSASAN